jgi:hypothetical protein
VEEVTDAIGGEEDRRGNQPAGGSCEEKPAEESQGPEGCEVLRQGGEAEKEAEDCETSDEPSNEWPDRLDKFRTGAHSRGGDFCRHSRNSTGLDPAKRILETIDGAHHADR